DGLGSQALRGGPPGVPRPHSSLKQPHPVRQPPAAFQATQLKLADMATQLDASRLLTRRAAWLKQEGRPFTREASMAKLYASEAAWRSTDHAIQLHGGYGYTRDYPVERYARDVRV